MIPLDSITNLDSSENNKTNQAYRSFILSHFTEGDIDSAELDLMYNTADEDGNTQLHYLFDHENFNAKNFKCLVGTKNVILDLNIVNDFNKTPLMVLLENLYKREQTEREAENKYLDKNPQCYEGKFVKENKERPMVREDVIETNYKTVLTKHIPQMIAAGKFIPSRENIFYLLRQCTGHYIDCISNYVLSKVYICHQKTILNDLNGIIAEKKEADLVRYLNELSTIIDPFTADHVFNTQEEHGESILHYLLNSELLSINIISALAKFKNSNDKLIPNFRLADSSGNTPMMYAISNKHKNNEFFKSLISSTIPVLVEQKLYFPDQVTTFMILYRCLSIGARDSFEYFLNFKNGEKYVFNVNLICNRQTLLDVLYSQFAEDEDLHQLVRERGGLRRSKLEPQKFHINDKLIYLSTRFSLLNILRTTPVSLEDAQSISKSIKKYIDSNIPNDIAKCEAAKRGYELLLNYPHPDPLTKWAPSYILVVLWNASADKAPLINALSEISNETPKNLCLQTSITRLVLTLHNHNPDVHLIQVKDNHLFYDLFLLGFIRYECLQSFSFNRAATNGKPPENNMLLQKDLQKTLTQMKDNAIKFLYQVYNNSLTVPGVTGKENDYFFPIGECDDYISNLEFKSLKRILEEHNLKPSSSISNATTSSVKRKFVELE